MSVDALVPAVVPLGRSSVTILGRNFPQRQSSSCRVGYARLAPARWLNASALACEIEVSAVQNVSIAVVLHGVGAATLPSAGARTLQVAAVELERVDPSSVPAAGGALVEVVPRRFTSIPREGVLCLFVRETSPLVCTAAACTCMAPAMDPQQTEFALADEAGRPITRSVPFAVLGLVLVDGLRPSVGGLEGGAVVTVTGSGFTEMAAVALAGVPLETQYVSVSRLLCVLPPHRAGSASVSVAGNGRNFVAGGADFLFVVPPTLRELLPARRLLGASASTVTVIGAGFEDSETLSCKFGTQRAVPAAWQSSSRVVCASSAQRTGQVAVQVSNDGSSFSPETLALLTRAPMELVSVAPSQSFAGVAARITVTGRGFPANSSALVCKVGRNSFPAVNVTTTSLVCVVTTRDPVREKLTVSDSDLPGASALAPLDFHVADTYRVASAIPSAGFRGTGFVVTVVGSGFVPGGTALVCRFGQSEAPATVASSSQVACAVPAAAAPGLLQVSVADANVDGPSSESLPIQILPHIALAAVEPSAGPAAGGTRLLLSAKTPFPDEAQLVCLFGRRHTELRRAIRVSASIVSCSTPTSERSGNVSVVVSVLDAAAPPPSAALAFQYVVTPVLASLFPSAGPVGGGTAIVLGVRNAASGRVQCHFADAHAPGARVSVAGTRLRRGLVECVTPRAAARGAVAVHVSVGGGESTGSLSFLYAAPFAVTTLRPSVGGTSGGVEVTVLGESMPTMGKASCVFGAQRVRATLVSSSQLSCRAPPAGARGAVALSVTAPAWSEAAPARDFVYVADARVVGVRPSSAPAGHSVALSISGAAFSASEIRCEFGSSPSYVSRAVLQSSSLVLCMTPADSRLGATQLSVQSDWGGELASLAFEFVTQPALDSISPSAGSMLGGTEVTLRGSNFPEHAACIVDEIIAPTKRVSASSVVCTTPPHAPKRVNVSLLSEEVDYKTEGLMAIFQYLAPLQVASVVPSFVPSVGGSVVTVYGHGFSPGHLFSRLHGARKWVRAAVVSSSTALCAATAHPAGETRLQLSTSASLPQPEAWIALTLSNSLHIVAADPSCVAARGATLITVAGRGFDDARQLQCAIGPALTGAISLGPGRIACPAPALAPAQYTLRVVVAQGAASNALNLRIVGEVAVWSVVPSEAPGTEQMLITVSGAGFAPSGVSCIFGDVSSIAHTVSHSNVTCLTPVHEAMRVLFRIEEASGVSSVEPVNFLFVEQPRVHFISPTRGAASAAAHTTVVGADFRAGLRCRFGAFLCDAQVLSSSKALCTSPQEQLGTMVLEIASQGALFVSTGMRFDSVPMPAVMDVQPRAGATAGSRVTIAGSRFAPTLYLVLRLGSMEIPVLDRASEASAIALIPDDMAPGNYTLAASNDGRLFSRGGPMVTIAGPSSSPPASPRACAQVSSGATRGVIARPSWGAVAGGSRVRVSGAAALEAPARGASWACRFGDAGTVPATFDRASRSVWCASPPHALAEALIELVETRGGVRCVVARAAFVFRNLPTLEAVTPRAVFEGAPAAVTMGLAAPVDPLLVERAWQCVFGGAGAAAVSAVRLNATALTCPVPALRAGNYTLRLTADDVAVQVQPGLCGAQARGLCHSASFTVLPPADAFAWSPVRAGTIAVRGRAFPVAAAVMCSFGGTESAATSVSATRIECAVPPRRAGAVLLELFADGARVAGSGMVYVFRPVARDVDGVVLTLSPSSGIGAWWDAADSRRCAPGTSTLRLRRCTTHTSHSNHDVSLGLRHAAAHSWTRFCAG